VAYDDHRNLAPSLQRTHTSRQEAVEGRLHLSEQERAMFCPKCGTETPDESHFCRKCGLPLNVEVPSRIVKPNDRARRLVGVLVAVVLVTVAVFIFASKVTKLPSQGASVPANSLAAREIEQGKKDQEALTRLNGGTVDSDNTKSAPRLLSPQEIYQSQSPGVILIQTYDDAGQAHALGSGFVVSSTGTAITNYHVIRGASRATVTFSDGTRGSVDGVSSYDPNRDLAVLRISPTPKAVLEIADSDKVQVGDKVVAIGSPLGLQNTMSVGIVSAMRNGVIQISDPISPGSSGGAVFDEHGKVVAVAVAQMTTGQNLNFALPINWAKPYLNSQNLKPLSDVIAENTVTENLLSGSLMVAKGQANSWNLAINQNRMTNAVVTGEVSSAGGLDGKITLMLVSNGRPLYSCRERVCQIHQNISPGVYTLVLDNRVSPIFGRTVTGQVSLKYVK